MYLILRMWLNGLFFKETSANFPSGHFLYEDLAFCLFLSFHFFSADKKPIILPSKTQIFMRTATEMRLCVAFKALINKIFHGFF